MALKPKHQKGCGDHIATKAEQYTFGLSTPTGFLLPLLKRFFRRQDSAKGLNYTKYKIMPWVRYQSYTVDSSTQDWELGGQDIRSTVQKLVLSRGYDLVYRGNH